MSSKRYSIPGLTMLERRTQAPDPTEAVAQEICCRVGSILKFHYPLHLWQVGIVGDLLYFRAGNLSNKVGIRLPVREVVLTTGKMDDKKFMRLGGELLERFGVRRGKLTMDEHLKVKRDIAGNGIAL